MQSAKPKILCTGPVEKPLHGLPGASDIIVDILPLTTITLKPEKVSGQIEAAIKQKANVVFTSSNALRALAPYLEETKPDWTIFCIGNSTFELAKKYVGPERIKQTAPNARALAEKIIPFINEREVIFFCGNLRRNDLPQALKENNIAVKEIEVYETTLAPRKIDEPYDAILFFSPSAALSFFSVNTIPANTVLFVMGKATADEIRKHTANQIVSGTEPDKYQLISKAIRFIREKQSLS